MPVNKSALKGRWSVKEVTQALKGQDDKSISETMMLVDSGKTRLEGPPAAPAITVEIRDGGDMSMTIVQTMRPAMPAVMRISALIDWKLEEDRMFTQARADSLETRVIIDENHGLSAEDLEKLKAQLPEIGSSAREGMRNNPVWSGRNAVTVLYAGGSCFLTRGEAGNLMLHQRLK